MDSSVLEEESERLSVDEVDGDVDGFGDNRALLLPSLCYYAHTNKKE